MANDNEVISYPANMSEEYGYDKWMLFTVKSGRHILRNRDGLSATKPNQPVPNSPLLKLYLPENALRSELNLRWEGESYGPVLGAVLQSAADQKLNTKIEDIIQRVNSGSITSDNISSNLGNFINPLAKTAASATVASVITREFEGLGQLMTGTDRLKEKLTGIIGQAPNPRTDVFFQGVEFRTHTFTWTLVPRNAKEAQNIDIILNAFQFYSLPSFGSGGASSMSSNGYFMGYPYEWHVQMFSEMLPSGGTAKRSKHHINTIDDSVITRVDIDHASDKRVSFIVDGELVFYPASTTLSVYMKEVRMQGRNDQDVIWRGLTTQSDARPNSDTNQEIKDRYNDPNKPLLGSSITTTGTVTPPGGTSPSPPAANTSPQTPPQFGGFGGR